MNRSRQLRWVAGWTWAPAALLVAAACGGGGEQPPASDTAAAPPATGAPGGAGAVASGEQIYQQRCITCHMANGEGTPGVFPPLAGSEYATAANVAVPASIVVFGLQGPVDVKGTQYNGIMPPYGTGIEMSNEEVAAVLTHVRSSFGNSASAVTPEDVAKARSARTGSGAMTAQELKPMMQ